jgi:Ni,Fe-hydrogenase III large subunit
MRYHLRLGPFHPGWPGPLQLNLEVEDGVVRAAEGGVSEAERLRAEDWAGLSLREGLLGVERLCASSSWAYSTAYCQALETYTGLEVPLRARFLRVILAELERMSSHLVNVAKFLHLSGLRADSVAMLDLRERVVQTQRQLTGRRLFPGLNVPGGLTQDITTLGPVLDLVLEARRPLYRRSNRIISNRTVAADMVGAGLLTKEKAEEEGLGGPVVRASELDRDLRRDQPYAAYGELEPRVVTQGGGDVFARLTVLLLETMESLRLLEKAVREIPAGPVCANQGVRVPAGETQSRVEAPVGPLVVRLQVGGDDESEVELTADSSDSTDEVIPKGKKEAILGQVSPGSSTPARPSGYLARLWRTAPSQVLQAALPHTLVGQPLDWVGLIVSSWGLCSPCLVR